MNTKEDQILNEEVKTKFTDDEILLTAEDVQKYLGIGKSRLYELMNDKSFPCFREGRRWLIPKKKFLEYIDRRCNANIKKIC